VARLDRRGSLLNSFDYGDTWLSSAIMSLDGEFYLNLLDDSFTVAAIVSGCDATLEKFTRIRLCAGAYTSGKGSRPSYIATNSFPRLATKPEESA
jgi:hypothetical protein